MNGAGHHGASMIGFDFLNFFFPPSLVTSPLLYELYIWYISTLSGRDIILPALLKKR